MTDATHDKIQAEISKLLAETSRLNQQIKWYVPVLFATGGAGLVTIGILVARFFIIEVPK